ncbi:hypothetical protein ACRAWF_44440 [Streptomyces sp. L7]
MRPRPSVSIEGMMCGAVPVATDIGDSASIVAGHGIITPPDPQGHRVGLDRGGHRPRGVRQGPRPQPRTVQPYAHDRPPTPPLPRRPPHQSHHDQRRPPLSPNPSSPKSSK